MSQVLVIDDDADTRAFLKVFLADAGHQTLEAEEGMSGIECAFAHPPDIVLLDLVMPNVDGFAVISALREEPATSDIPIIMLSGTNDLDSVSRAFQLGAKDFLDKPCTRADVLNAIKTANPKPPRQSKESPWPNWDWRT